jgi:hypothetical protein
MTLTDSDIHTSWRLPSEGAVADPWICFGERERRTAGLEALRRCVGDHEGLVHGDLPRRPFVVRDGDRDFSDLIDLDGVDLILATRDLRHPQLQLFRTREAVPPDSYSAIENSRTTPHGPIEVSRVLAELESGATMTIVGAHELWPPLRQFCLDLSAIRAGSASVDIHLSASGPCDSGERRAGTDCFVMQVAGQSRWRIWARPQDGILEPDRSELGSTSATSVDVALDAGESLYLPTGTTYRTVGGAGPALTLLTWSPRPSVADVLREALAAVAKHRSALRRSLPPGFASEEQLSHSAAAEAIDAMAFDTASIHAAAAERFWSEQRAVPVGWLRAHLTVGSIDGRTFLRRQPGFVVRMQVVGDDCFVRMDRREIRLPAWAAPCVERLVAGDSVQVEEIAELIGLDDALVISRRLVRDGVLARDLAIGVDGPDHAHH